MLSQFGKTIKKALKSSQKERQLLRARSAVQRFPVVEWRQRTEDFHKRSIHASRRHAGSDAWRKADGDTGGLLPIQHVGDWDPVQEEEPNRPSWGDQETLLDTPGMRSSNVSQENLAAGQPLLTTPNRDSFASDISLDTPNRNSFASQHQYNSFLERANRQFAQQNQGAPDPFLDPGRASLGARPYSQYSTSSRLSSVESIATIVDEKQNSPLNKATDSVWLDLQHALINHC
jgi:alpha-1,3-glucan synthase